MKAATKEQAEFVVPIEAKAEIVPAQPKELAPVTTMPLLEIAVRNGASIEVIERLKALYDREREKAEEADFNAAMNRVQAGLVRVAPDLNNPQTHSKYASYAAIDRVLRPVYSKEGFSLSFNTEESKLAEHVKIVCFVSHSGGFTRRYQVDMPADGKGAKGGDVMTKTHATASAMSYGKRYLAGFVFNLAIGLDDDGNAASAELPGIVEMLKAIEEAPDMSALKPIFGDSYRKAKLAKNSNAELLLIGAYDKRKAELSGEAA